VIWESLQVPVPVGVADGVFEGDADFVGLTLGDDDAAGVGESLAAGDPDVVGDALGELDPRPVSSQRTPSRSARTTTSTTTRRNQ
jgi:hypothetical protein